MYVHFIFSVERHFFLEYFPFIAVQPLAFAVKMPSNDGNGMVMKLTNMYNIIPRLALDICSSYGLKIFRLIVHQDLIKFT